MVLLRMFISVNKKRKEDQGEEDENENENGCPFFVSFVLSPFVHVMREDDVNVLLYVIAVTE